jgi:hypothetical protein
MEIRKTWIEQMVMRASDGSLLMKGGMANHITSMCMIISPGINM